MSQTPVLVPTPPTAAATRAFTFPAMDRCDLGGVHVRSVHVPGRPLARLLVRTDAGSMTEPADAWGVAALLSRSMQRGADGRDAHGLAVAFERLGTTPTTSSGVDGAVAQVTVPPGLLAQAAALLAGLVRRPTLASDDVIEVRSALVDEHLTALTQPATKADRALRAAVWDGGCRLSTPAAGSETTVAPIEPDQVRAFHDASWVRAPLAVVVVGNLTGVDLEAVAAPFRLGETVAPAQTEVVDRASSRRILLVDVPGAAQSQLSFGRVGPAFGHEGEEALDVAMTATAGTFSSRLMQRLREELGYTYGARATMTRWRAAGMLSSSFSVRTEVTADALQETVGVLDRALGDGLDDAEVEHARANLALRLPVSLDGVGAIAGSVSALISHDLPDDYHQRRLERLRTVDTATASSALRDHVSTDDLQLVVVGDAAEVRADLEALGLGPVSTVSP